MKYQICLTLAKAAGNKDVEKKYRSRLRAIKKKYNAISEATGIKAQPDKMRVFGKTIGKLDDSILDDKNIVAKSEESGIINNRSIASRNMALGMRKSPMHILTDDEIATLKNDIKAIGADESVFEFNKGRYTGYNDITDRIKVRGDILPDTNSYHPRDLMSSRAVIAHEYYGHRAYRGTVVPKGSWNDEFRASYMAAKNTPNLSDEDRRYLILDALERAKEKGVAIKNNKFIRRILYGY